MNAQDRPDPVQMRILARLSPEQKLEVARRLREEATALEVVRVECAREARGHFNLIHHGSGMKADVYLTARDPLHRWGLANRRRIRFGEGELAVAPAEYVIVRKLALWSEGGSGKHIRDIRAMLAANAPPATDPDAKVREEARQALDSYDRSSEYSSQPVLQRTGSRQPKHKSVSRPTTGRSTGAL